MSKWVNATGNPKGFVEAVKSGQSVYADFDENTSLEWNCYTKKLLYVYPDPRWKGEYCSSSFPALFKRTDQDMLHIFAFYDRILELNGEKQ